MVWWYLKPALMAVLASASVTFIYAAIALSAGVSLWHAGTSVFPALLDQLTSEPPINVFFLLSLLRAPAWSSSPSPLTTPSKLKFWIKTN